MKFKILLPALSLLIGGIAFGLPAGERRDRAVDLSQGLHGPGSYRHGSYNGRIAAGLTGSPSMPGSITNGGYPFIIGSRDWQRWTDIGNNVEITSMEQGKISYRFWGGGGGGNRGDMVFFWIRATAPAPIRYRGYLEQTHEWYERDDYGNSVYGGYETNLVSVGDYTFDREVAEASLQPAESPKIPDDWDDGNDSVSESYGVYTYSASNTWILVHIARSHSGAGNPSSPPPSNGALYAGEFTYDTATLGGGELRSEMFNFQRTKGDDNKVQTSDSKSHGEVPLGLMHGGPPRLEITGPTGRFPLNP